MGVKRSAEEIETEKRNTDERKTRDTSDDTSLSSICRQTVERERKHTKREEREKWVMVACL